VYPGGFEKGEYSNYDYKRTPLDKDYWFASIDDVSVPSAEDKQILEIPLFALPVKRWKKYNPIRIKSILINKKSAFETIKAKTAKTSILKKIKYWFEEESITWDFCLFNKKMNIIFFNYIENNLKSKRKTFVLVGHPKNFSSKKTLEGLITEAHRRNYSFTTLENYAANILDNYNKNT
ncbi:MAG: hypothetical protein LPJ98_14735, partial [Cyclobacteriaceae bacterium]|nr:hypothetical protein [Cyclobacteriaceae bacterium]